MVWNVMVRQHILLMGNIKQKWERDSHSGYLMEYNATPLTNQDIHNATVDLATLQIDPLVEIAYKEASAICQDLLGILAPTVTIDKPLKLAVMGALSQGHKEPVLRLTMWPPMMITAMEVARKFLKTMT